MKRVRIPGVLDLLLSKDAREIETLAQDPVLDRAYGDRSLLLNGYILRRVRKTLQIDGRPFPTVAAREAPGRGAEQSALWTRLSAAAPHFADGPEELEQLASYVRGEGSATECGPLVQEVVGRLFAPEFRATEASWAAALVLDKAPRTMNPALLLWWAATGRVERAKQLLSEMVGGDPAAVHAIGIALHNIVSGVTLMRQLFPESAESNSLSPEDAGSRCIFAPASVLRQPSAPTSSAAGELKTSTVVLLSLQTANATSSDPDVAFLRSSWSRCPAERWVPALLEGVWRRARRLTQANASTGAAVG